LQSALFLSLALAGLALASVPARAADDETQVSARDLDLRTFAGQDELHHRVARAAKRVCGPAELRSSTFYDYYNDCVKKTEARAESQVQSLIAAARSNSVSVAALLVQP
jgi:UrcA family protein